MTDETYIGDGCYALFDGFMFILRAPRMEGDHWIGLEPEVLRAFDEYRKHVEAQIKSIADQAGSKQTMYTIKLHQEPDCTSDNLETISQTYVDYCNRHSEFRHGSTTLYNDMGKKIGYVTALGVIWGEPVSPLLYQPPKAAKTQ